MTEYEALQEFINEEMTNSINSKRTAEFVLPDILDYFTSNVPSYNKELEEENRVLRDQIEAFVEFNDVFAYKASEMVGIYKKDQMLKQMRGK